MTVSDVIAERKPILLRNHLEEIWLDRPLLVGNFVFSFENADFSCTVDDKLSLRSIVCCSSVLATHAR